jgi:hypothetical protein
LAFPKFEANQFRLYYLPPTHLDFAEVTNWEQQVFADPTNAPIYADWLGEHGWPEREAAVRGVKS